MYDAIANVDWSQFGKIKDNWHPNGTWVPPKPCLHPQHNPPGMMVV